MPEQSGVRISAHHPDFQSAVQLYASIEQTIKKKAHQSTRSQRASETDALYNVSTVLLLAFGLVTAIFVDFFLGDKADHACRGARQRTMSKINIDREDVTSLARDMKSPLGRFGKKILEHVDEIASLINQGRA